MGARTMNLATIALVGCGKSKRSTRSTAADLYTGQLFQAARAYATGNADAWVILSAHHGVLSPSREIDPYDVTLATMTAPSRASSAERTAFELAVRFPRPVRFVLLAGRDYGAALDRFRDVYPGAGAYDIERPLEGLGIGQRLGWFAARRQLAQKAVV